MWEEGVRNPAAFGGRGADRKQLVENIEERLYREVLPLFAKHPMLKEIYKHLSVIRNKREVTFYEKCLGEGAVNLQEERKQVLEGMEKAFEPDYAACKKVARMNEEIDRVLRRR